MSTASKISWTDATWNPARGCTKVSPGCAHCYAETFAERWRGIKGHAYEHGFDLQLVPAKLDEPLHWRKPKRVFVNSMSDLFHEGIPFEFIYQVFDVMARCPQHTFQILTKRAARMLACLSRAHDKVYDQVFLSVFLDGGRLSVGGLPWPLPNVWLGVSAEDQPHLDKRVGHLLACPAAVRFVSLEPLLGPIDLDRVTTLKRPIDWVIVGGESGPKFRPCEIRWITDIVDQCRMAGVPTWVKQDSGLRPGQQGRIPDEYWVHEFPKAATQ